MSSLKPILLVTEDWRGPGAFFFTYFGCGLSAALCFLWFLLHDGPSQYATRCAGIFFAPSPAAKTMYCLPFNMYVIGRLCTWPVGTVVSQMTAPVFLS